MELCKKINECMKVVMILDKDMAGDWQYAEVIRAVCNSCPDKETE